MQISRRAGLLLWVVVPVGLVALGTVAFLAQLHFTSQPLRAGDLVMQLSGWVVCGALAPAVYAASRHWPFSAEHWVGRTMLHLAFAFLYWGLSGLVLQGMLPAVLEWVEAPPSQAPAPVVVRVVRWFLSSLPFGALVYFAIVGAEHALRYFTEARERAVRLVEAEERLTRARLAALQSQVNPHFLFNALNTIAVRAREGDGRGTAQLVEGLSDILRQTLSRDQMSEVTLADEMEVVRQYLTIEKARFADRLTVELAIDQRVMLAAIPPFVVQHLAENAVRHGLASRSDAGCVRIGAHRDGDWLEVTVSDDGAGITREAELRPGGLANTRERLRSVYGETAASLALRHAEPRGTVATVRVPYREVTLEATRVGA